jgi:hypothetical protein
MRPSLDVAVPRAEKQLATAQHLLLVGGWLPQRPRRAWARHARTPPIVNHGALSWRGLIAAKVMYQVIGKTWRAGAKVM